jgi:Ca-activated chloride channel family protein
MTFLQPVGLWLLGLIPVILLIHFFRATPRRITVPAAFLWRDLNSDLSASKRRRPPPLSWLLLLQLLAAALVALAVASPRVVAPPPRHLVLLLDASASMLAADLAPSRFEHAVQRAGALLGALGPQDRATLIRVGPSPSLVVEQSDPVAAQTALGGLRAGAGSAAMREALAFGGAVAARLPEAAAELVVLSDGAFADPGDLSQLGVPIHFEMLGQSAENQAITSVQVARQPRPGAGLAVFGRVVNYAERPARLPVRLLADGVVQDTREVEVGARGRAELAFNVPDGARRVTVALGGRDALAADDSVEVAVDSGRARSVLLVSRLPGVMERALRAIPDLRVETVSPEAYGGQAAELVVFDGFLPEQLPNAQLLIVNPPSGRDYLKVEGELRTVRISDHDARHPLLQSVDLTAARLARMTLVQPPPWARSVADANGRPLILEGRDAGSSIVILAFDPTGSGIDRLLAFPLILSNAVAFLGGGETAPYLAPGRIADVPVTPGVREVRLERPDGPASTLAVRGSSVTIQGLEQPGRYAIRELGAGAGEARVFSINVANEAESDIAPRQRAAVAGPPPPVERASTSPFEIWPALLALGLVVLGAEWWRFGRRG